MKFNVYFGTYMVNIFVPKAKLSMHINTEMYVYVYLSMFFGKSVFTEVTRIELA